MGTINTKSSKDELGDKNRNKNGNNFSHSCDMVIGLAMNPHNRVLKTTLLFADKKEKIKSMI
jgi:hypothetical protein